MAGVTPDVIVVGAGPAGLTAACVAAAEGLSVRVMESTPYVGGTGAISGGMVWAPANDFLPGDSIEAARTFLGEVSPGADGDASREAFLAHAADMVRYMAAKTSLRFRPVTTYPDYYPDLPGATTGGRVLEPETFDGRELGDAFSWLRPPLPELTLFGGMMISRADIPHFRKVYRSWGSALKVAKLVAAYAAQRLTAPRGATLYLGNALMGRLLKSALDLGVEIRREVSVEALLRGADGRVAGVTACPSGGRPGEVRAARGVILATGGLGHDAELRARHFPALGQETTAAVPPGATVGARLAAGIGGRVAQTNANGAFWVPASRFRRRDGSQGFFPHTVTDRSKPGLIAVNADGRRFVNEARSYHEFVLAQLREGPKAVPAWMICDSNFLWTYGLGAIRPFRLSLRHELESGYLKSGSSVAELARGIGVPEVALVETVSRFNADARQGRDSEFGRGGDAYQRYLGDAEVTPNPCVKPIERAPFHAIAVYPADLGAATGLATDEQARVLDADNRPIPGLYACGNDMHSVMDGAYPGPGITLGPALTFAYLAALDIAGS
jgi:succinate dehydrogenase/fumarate reductase flavoprotein subunit